MANKMTKMDSFKAVKTIINASSAKNKEELIAFIDHEMELLNKKSSSSKATPTQAANMVTLNVIKEVLSEQDKAVTIGELMADERLKTYTESAKEGEKTITMTNQKMSAMLKKLVDAKEVVKTYQKKVAYFSLADENTKKVED